MNARERFQKVMHFKEADRLPFCEFLGYWGETINRWYSEGLPWGVDVHDYFGFDKALSGGVKERIPIDFGPIPRFVSKTLKEDERYRIEVDEIGITKKVLKTSTSIPAFLDFPVKSQEDFEKIKSRFDPKDSRRYPKAWSDELVEYYETADHPVSLHFNGFFGQARHFMGLQNLLVAFYRAPELVHDIMGFWTDFVIETMKEAVEEVKIDFISIWEDMAYRNGPLISPALFREFMLPCYKKVTNFIRKRGVDIIMVDTDGNHEILIPLFLEAEVNCFYPLEVQSEMNVVTLRKKYGKRLLLIGGIDKRALIEGNEAVKGEIDEKLTPSMKEGGYIPSVDHCVPPDVSFLNYAYYISLLKKSLEYDERL